MSASLNHLHTCSQYCLKQTWEMVGFFYGLCGVLASIADLMKASVPSGSLRFSHSTLFHVTPLKMPPLIRFLLKAVNRIMAWLPRHAPQSTALGQNL